MKKQDIVKNVMSDLETNPRNALKYFTDDFVFSGPVPEPIGAQEWVDFHLALKSAFPDWRFNVQNLQEEKDEVRLTCQITGTHRGDLHLPDMPVVPSTGKRINLPKEPITVTFSGDKISEVKVQTNSSGGLSGIYKQIGAEFPERVPV